MKRFDRITSLLLLLQTRTVVTASFLAEHFEVTERTIYRDIRTLETAGVPIGAEAGVGYFLEKSYRLPPVCFTLDEAASLVLGEKLLINSLDQESLQDFKQALNKVRSVINATDKEYLETLDNNTKVLPSASHFPIEEQNAKANNLAASVIEPNNWQCSAATADKETNTKAHQGLEHQGSQASGNQQWLRECRQALVSREIISITYRGIQQEQASNREIQPIGLFYYNWHWHLIAWCQLRQAYRDFRVDRIINLVFCGTLFKPHNRLSLQQYLDAQPERADLLDVELLFTHQAARFVEEQRYLFGFVSQQPQPTGIGMRFLNPIPDYMARWLLQYLGEVTVVRGEPIKQALSTYSAQLFQHWTKKS